jgi:protein CpxP
MVMLAGMTLAISGCLAVATAPIRVARREKAEAAFDRLAELTPEQIAGFLNNRMAASLALTDNQRPRIEGINLEHARKLRVIAGSDDGVRAKGRAVNKLNDAHEAALKEVLTAEQFTKFLELKEQLRDFLKDSAQTKK